MLVVDDGFTVSIKPLVDHFGYQYLRINRHEKTLQNIFENWWMFIMQIMKKLFWFCII
jgi:hypothetical protein